MPDELTGWISYLLRQAALRAQSEVARSFAELGLRPPHHAVMAAIEAVPMSQIALANRLRSDRSAMVAIIDDLERMQLAERRPNPVDRRAHEVTLTEAGQVTLHKSSARLRAIDERLLAGFDAADRNRLRTLLKRLIADFDQTSNSTAEQGS